MQDLSINKSTAIQQHEQEHQKVPANSVLGNIQGCDLNRQLYSAFLKSNNDYHVDTYNQKLKEKKHKKTIIAISGGVTLLLGGAGVILGRKNIVKLRGKLNQSIEILQELKENKHLKTLGRAKLATIKFFKDALGCIFTFDKVKDFSLLKGFNSLGKPGKLVVEASKGSLWITEKTTLAGLYQAFKMNVNSVGKSVKKALKSPEIFTNAHEKQLAEKLNILLNGNIDSKGLTHFADDLIIGIKERTGSLKNTIQKKNIDKYREKYYPKSFTWEEFKRAGKSWKDALFSTTSNKDVLRENWKTTEDALIKNIDKTGANKGAIKHFGHARIQIDNITKEMDELCSQSDCSAEFKNLVKQVKKLNERINNSQSAANPIAFETSGEKYAGRVLDLAAGGGMSEILIPPIAGGLVAYHTLKDSQKGERKEKFIRSGGLELIGGLAGWMVTANLLAISGAPGMLAGLATAGIMNIVSRNYLK